MFVVFGSWFVVRGLWFEALVIEVWDLGFSKSVIQ